MTTTTTLSSSCEHDDDYYYFSLSLHLLSSSLLALRGGHYAINYALAYCLLSLLFSIYLSFFVFEVCVVGCVGRCSGPSRAKAAQKYNNKQKRATDQCRRAALIMIDSSWSSGQREREREENFIVSTRPCLSLPLCLSWEYYQGLLCDDETDEDGQWANSARRPLARSLALSIVVCNNCYH